MIKISLPMPESCSECMIRKFMGCRIVRNYIPKTKRSCWCPLRSGEEKDIKELAEQMAIKLQGGCE